MASGTIKRTPTDKLTVFSVAHPGTSMSEIGASIDLTVDETAYRFIDIYMQFRSSTENTDTRSVYTCPVSGLREGAKTFLGFSLADSTKYMHIPTLYIYNHKLVSHGGLRITLSSSTGISFYDKPQAYVYRIDLYN